MHIIHKNYIIEFFSNQDGMIKSFIYNPIQYVLYHPLECVFVYNNVSLFNQAIGLLCRVFANGPGDRGSIPDWVIPKLKKWYLMLPCLTRSIIR